MDSATTTAIPIEAPEGTELAFAVAVFYCRRSDHAAIAARLVAEKGAEVTPRFNIRTGEAEPAEVKWTENGIRCSLDPAPAYHHLYDAEAAA